MLDYHDDDNGASWAEWAADLFHSMCVMAAVSWAMLGIMVLLGILNGRI